jgi:hypothetical protein
MRLLPILLVLAALSISQTGCGVGYVTYFEPALRGGRAVPHPDPYTRPPPPAAVEVMPRTVSVGSPNLRKFLLLPIPWFRLSFFPRELQVALTFHGEPSVAVIDLGAVSATLDGQPVIPAKIEYQGVRPAPEYVRTISLPNRGLIKMEDPRALIFTYRAEAGDADALQIRFGELTVDGKRATVPSVAFTREGQFVVYRRPKKPAAHASVIDEPEGGGDVLARITSRD